jgi:outer membrane murein-binding lipoprotein Lpp
MPIKLRTFKVKENMRIKTKIVSLAAATFAGLLLGGNAFAGGAEQNADYQTISAQIQEVQKKVSQLMTETQSGEKAAPVVNMELTPEKLDNIEREVTRIAKETERLKIEVAIYLTLEDIGRKTAALAAQIAAGLNVSASMIAAAPAAPIVAALPADLPASKPQANEEIEAQIAIVRRQIDELTEEMVAQTAAEKEIPAEERTVAGTEDEGAKGNVAASEEKDASLTVERNGGQDSAATKGGLWQAVGDFFKKLFAF